MQFVSIRRLRTRVAFVALCAVALAAADAQARTFEVTRHDDPVPGKCKADNCSVREAVQAANAHSGADVVVLPDRKAPYRLTRENTIPNVGESAGIRGDLDAAGKLTMRHSGRGRATIDATQIDRVIEILGGSLTISKLELTGGKADFQPGVDPPREARRGSGPYGAAIYSEGGLLKLDRSLVRKNKGAFSVIEMFGQPNSSSRISRSTLSNNSGGVQISGVHVSRSMVRANGSIGLYLQGKSTVDRTAVARNDGLGIAVEGYDAKITNSTISGNRDGGVSIQFGSHTSITNSTISGNRTNESGGGISVYSFGSEGTSLLLNSVTIAGNRANTDGDGFGEGGGVWGNDDAALGVVNSIIAGNRSGSAPDDCSGGFSVDSDGGNLISIDGECAGFEPGAGDFLAKNPKLGELGSNGGPTKTRALRKGSKAIGRAIKQAAPKRDQRGFKRDSKPDIGAYER